MTRQTAKTGETFKLRDEAAARLFLLQSLWTQRTATPANIRGTLELALTICGEGAPLLPLGVLADCNAILRGEVGAIPKQAMPPGIPPATIRQYEAHGLNRLLADARIERAAAALGRYAKEERSRGVAFAIRRIAERLKPGGVELSPAIVRELLKENPDELLREGWASLERDGAHPSLNQLLESLIASARRSADILAPEDVLAIEQRMALADLAQFVAHRQLLQCTARLEESLPLKPPKPCDGGRDIATRIREEDHYPVGGYASIGTRGSLESLLHSQLAYMEDHESPDLFDVKFVRDELFYYTRDENEFLRRRRAFGFYFANEMTAARFKDAAAPAQRIVLAGAMVLAAIRKLTAWLSHDALRFEVLFDPALSAEADLFRVLLHDEIRRGIATVETVSDRPTLRQRWESLGRTTQLHALSLSPEAAAGDDDWTHLRIDGSFDGSEALNRLLQSWI